MLMRSAALPGQPLFSPLTLSEYERHILKGAEMAGLDPLRVTPHSARHGGASSAVHLKLLDLKMIQKRGRWLAPRSVKRYEKAGKLLRQVAAIRDKIPDGELLLQVLAEEDDDPEWVEDVAADILVGGILDEVISAAMEASRSSRRRQGPPSLG